MPLLNTCIYKIVNFPNISYYGFKVLNINTKMNKSSSIKFTVSKKFWKDVWTQGGE